MRVIHVVGARPNFMKAAPAYLVLAERGVTQSLVHTGQHYSPAMSDVFLDQLGLGKPDVNLEVGSASHAQQTADVMVRFEQYLQSLEAPNIVLVYGDVNSTVAAALVCAKLGIPVAHVEAGLRSRDRTMPEEINRIVTDSIADVLFTPSHDADENLVGEGVSAERIFCIGNLMIDTLLRLRKRATQPAIDDIPTDFALVTLHRPSNVDQPTSLKLIAKSLARISQKLPVLFPVHPRTRSQLTDIGLLSSESGVRLLEPLGYLQFLWLQERAAVVITDSGGIQEETTFLGVPCLTLRENTERPITVTEGTNKLIGREMPQLEREIDQILKGNSKPGRVPDLWDGHAGKRLADVICGERLGHALSSRR